MIALTRKVGLLAVILVPFFLLAIALHRAYLPPGYGWLGPIRTLTAIVREPFFPTLAAVALAIGAASRADWKAQLADLRKEIPRETVLRALRGALIVIVPLVLLGAIFGDYEPSDFVALLAIGGAFGTWKWNRTGFVRAALQLVYVLVIFTVVSYSFTVVKSLIFKFRTPHDAQIVAVEQAILRFRPHEAIARWASTRPWAVIFSDQIYFALFKHMTLTSLFLIGAREKKLRTELIASLVICYVLGGITYYLWPGLGPGYFAFDQYAYLERLPTTTRIVRALLHQNTASMATGHPRPIVTYAYIACMPSLHMAHELVMLWYARTSRVAFGISLVFTTLTLFAIVILGWHYPIDAVAGAMLAATAIAIAHRNRDRLLPAALHDDQ